MQSPLLSLKIYRKAASCFVHYCPLPYPRTWLHPVKFLLILPWYPHCVLLPAGAGVTSVKSLHKGTWLAGEGHSCSWDTGNCIDLKRRYFPASLAGGIWSADMLRQWPTTHKRSPQTSLVSGNENAHPECRIPRFKSLSYPQESEPTESYGLRG